jgi:uncharacterized membrane protein SirB2
VIEFAEWLQATPLSVFIQSHTWITPLLQAIHIVMISIVFVSVAMILLRIMGRVSDDQPFEQVWRRFAPWLRVGLAIMAATGVLLILGEPVREATALSFWLKMGLIVVAVASIVYLHRALAGHTGTEISTGMKSAAIGAMVVWIAIVFLGRAIAYDVAVWGTWSFGA